MNLKAPKTYKEQIEQLKTHGMVFLDESRAEKILSEINYYRFTGYALQYRKESDDSDYSKSISFDEIYCIYRFDEALRDILRKYIEKIEIYFRTLIAYHFAMAKCKEEPHDQHYDENNFYNKNGYNDVMDSFSREKNYYKDSPIVKHHKSKYDNRMPLWVIVELMSFSNISKLYNAMYLSEKNRIAAALGISASTLENHLHCLAVLRNKCAHAARLYNTEFNPPARFNSQFLRRNPEVKNNTLFAYLLIMIKRLPNASTKKELVEAVDSVIENYSDKIDIELMGFPCNYKSLLSQSLNN